MLGDQVGCIGKRQKGTKKKKKKKKKQRRKTREKNAYHYPNFINESIPLHLWFDRVEFKGEIWNSSSYNLNGEDQILSSRTNVTAHEQ